MKVRIKFSKEGPVKFVGHLDTMRYFQKAVRRAGLPAAFSGGFSPHMIMSFASPLGVGAESMGEYFDMELVQEVPTTEICDRLNAVMAEGVHVISARKVEDGKAGNAMSLVAAADYLVTFRPGKQPECLKADVEEKIRRFLALDSIIITKTTKKGSSEVDLRPNIYRMEASGDGVFYCLASASANFTKPEAVTQAFVSFLGEELLPFACQIRRLEVYADKGSEETGRKLVPLEALGEEVE